MDKACDCEICTVKLRMYAAAGLDKTGPGYGFEQGEVVLHALGIMLSELHAGMLVPDNQMRARLKAMFKTIQANVNDMRKTALADGRLSLPSTH